MGRRKGSVNKAKVQKEETTEEKAVERVEEEELKTEEKQGKEKMDAEVKEEPRPLLAKKKVCLMWNGASDISSATSLCKLRSSLVNPLRVTEGQQQAVSLSPGEFLLAFSGAHPRWELEAAVANKLRELLRPSEIPIPQEWDLKPHQEDGYMWLMARSASRLGGILADDMGLGKTRQAIAWLLGIRAKLQSDADADADGWHMRHEGCEPVQWKRALVLAPAMLVRGDDSIWVKELQEVSKLWRTPLKTWQWHADRARDFRSEAYTVRWKGPMIELFDVVVTSYESFLSHSEQFVNEEWTCVILDEAQYIKNHAAQTAMAAKKLSSIPYRLAMTGSPVENSLDDLHSILQFIQPDCTGSLNYFKQNFPSSEETSLRTLLQAVALRREAGGNIDMVAREEVEIPVRLTGTQERLYNMTREEHFTTPIKRCKDLELLCSHPWCYASKLSKEALQHVPERFLQEAKDQSVEESGKLQELFQILKGLKARREKVLVFFCRRVTGKLLEALIEREFGMKPGLIYGETDSAEKDRSMQKFRHGPLPGEATQWVLLLSVWVGAVGLNLPEARWVVHFERGWNPAREKQATSRAHRLTSKHPIKAYSLFTEKTIEEKKTAVLKSKLELSSRITEALDGNLDIDGDPEAVNDSELQQLLADLSSSNGRTSELDLDSKEVAEEDEEEGEPLEEGALENDDGVKNRGALPSFADLEPKELIFPVYGKYGDPQQPDLWDWYANQGHKDVHPRAPEKSTAPTLQRSYGHKDVSDVSRDSLSSRACRIGDIKARNDWEVTVDCQGTPVRLFIPGEQRCHFEKDKHGAWQLRPFGAGMAPFPIFIPSTGRSAVDPNVGLLDLTRAMIDADGQQLKYVQIVAVKSSEVDNYRTSSPFFIVMELPSSHRLQHPIYGSVSPENLGVGCSRHWLMRMASALGQQIIFMLDDSVRLWRGVTTANDRCSLFGCTPGAKPQLTTVPLARVLEHFTDPQFLAEEMPKISVLGFARVAPDLYRHLSKDLPLYRRKHVYSAFLVNVEKVMRQQRLNFKEDLYIWEDVHFNFQVKDVVKCFRFVMHKQPFRSGGCTAQIARSANPILRFTGPKKKSVGEIVAEVIGDETQVDDESITIRGARGKGKNEQKTTPQLRDPEQDPMKLDPFELEKDAALTVEGAVVDEKGNLSSSYYRAFIQAFKVQEAARPQDPAAPTGRKKIPGLRSDEDEPCKHALRLWDDTVSKTRGDNGEKWGAGWIANHPQPPDNSRGSGSRWFNIKRWGSWRLVLVLARLQHAVWCAKFEVQPKPLSEDGTPAKAKGRPSSSSTAESAEKKPRRGQVKEVKEVKKEKEAETKDNQKSLLSFFKKQEAPKGPPAKKQKTLTSFFGIKQEIKEESQSSSSAQASTQSPSQADTDHEDELK